LRVNRLALTLVDWAPVGRSDARLEWVALGVLDRLDGQVEVGPVQMPGCRALKPLLSPVRDVD
jgi:hypothetical protein